MLYVKQKKDGVNLHVDHDHSTGKIRALLCSGCNWGIAGFNEEDSRLRLAIKYLKKWKE